MTEIPLADGKAREQALAPERSFIVQAPAGSGKTELLVRRYLRLLSVATAPEEIVAITFTRKAAAEMRHRIIDALKAAGSAAPDRADTPDTNTQTRRQLATGALARDAELGWQLTANPARMKIQTIDSFCDDLTRRMPILSRLGGQAETVEDATDLYRQAAANTLKQLEAGDSDEDEERSAAVATLLARLDNDVPKTRDMLVSMLRKRDQWLRHLVGRRPDREGLEEALKHIVETTLESVVQTLPRESLPGFTNCLRFAAKNRDDAPGAFGELPGARADALPLWQFIVPLCLTGKGDWRKSLGSGQGFPPGADGKEMKQEFLSLLDSFGEVKGLRELFLEITELPQISYSAGDWRVIEALYTLLTLTNAQLYLLFAEHNQVDFTGVALAALQSLGEEENPTDLALYLDYRFCHVLVDEYQDISIGQYELLKRLTAGWSEGDGRSLFLVGDPMQSIYRFRDAEVGLFLNTWKERRLGQVPVEPVNIRVNFRSDQALVDWVNNAFPEVLPAQPDVARGAVSFTPALAFHAREEGSAVCVHPSLVRDDEREAQQALEQIKAIRQLPEPGNIAILVYSRSHLQSITAALIRAGLRFRALDIEQLGERPVIQDLMALTRALHHPADRVAWLALLRAPWCGLSLADLLALTADAGNQTILQCLRDRKKRETLSKPGRRRLQRVCDVIEKALTRQGRAPLRRWVEEVWINLGGPAVPESPTDLHNARTFFELLDTLEAGGDLRDRDEFIKKVGDLYAGADMLADDSLQVMTIHKAKGLEFDHVLLPGLSRGIRVDEKQLLIWSENPHQVGSDFLLAPVNASYENSSEIHDFIRGLEKRKASHEEARLLYVAITRARKQLHLFGSVGVNARGELQAPCSNTLLAHLWPAVRGDFQAYLASRSVAEEDAPTPAPAGTGALTRLSADWQLPAPPPATKWSGAPAAGREPGEGDHEDSRIEYQWAGRAIRHAGTLVHRCLKLMSTEGMEQWGAENLSARRAWYRESLRALGTPEAELDTACGWVEQALTELLADPRGQWLLADHPQQDSEYALSGVYRGGVVNIIIDRTFVDETGMRWIVDYKTSRHESGDVDEFLDLQQERYREQLEKYAVIMSALDDRPIRLGLYFPLLRGWREWAFSA